MATYEWAGDTPAVAEVLSFTVSYTSGTVNYTLTINGKDVTVAGVTDTASTVAALVLALNDSEIPEFAEITFSDASPELVLTADTAGKPIGTVTAAVSGGGTGTIDASPSTTTSNAGPNVWSANNVKNVADGTRGTLPTAGDVMFFRSSDVSLLYGLETAFAGDELFIEASYTGTIGLPRTNIDGSTSYSEYRERLWDTGDADVTIGGENGTGSSKLRFEVTDATDAAKYYIESTASSQDDDGAVELYVGSVGLVNVSINGGTLSIFTPIDGINGVSTLNASSGAAVTADVNTRLNTVTMNDFASCICSGFVSVLTMQGAPTFTYIQKGGNAVTANIYGGTFNLDAGSTGTITTVNLGPTATLNATDLTEDMTITNCTIEAGATINDSNDRLTFSNPIDLGQSGLTDVSLDLGRGINIQKS